MANNGAYALVDAATVATMQGLSIYETPFTNAMVLDKQNRRLYVPQGYTPVLAARFEAAAIVREGLADVLRWLAAANGDYQSNKEVNS